MKPATPPAAQPRIRDPLSRTSVRRMLVRLLARAEAGDVAAAEALIRLGLERNGKVRRAGAEASTS